MPAIPPDSADKIRRLARHLLQHYGAQNWWPADSPFEVVVGAILVQRTAWRNAELGVHALRDSDLLSPASIRTLSVEELERLIRPSGFYCQKAERLKGLVAFLHSRHSGSLEGLFRQPLTEARNQLLSLKGIGPETADTILLYAGGFPVFIVDTYARRLLSRSGAIPEALVLPYESVRNCVEHALLDCPLPPLHSRTPNHPASWMSTRDLTPRARFLAELHACIVRAEIEKLAFPVIECP